jgi:hypothetical protein
MRKAAWALVAVFTLTGVAHAADVVIPPVPPTWKWGKPAWERAVKRCAERPTEWSRERCIRGLYE